MLHSMIDRRKLSRFVAQALDQALREKKQVLREAYIEASKDLDRLKTIKEWEVLDGFENYFRFNIKSPQIR